MKPQVIAVHTSPVAGNFLSIPGKFMIDILGIAAVKNKSKNIKGNKNQ